MLRPRPAETALPATQAPAPLTELPTWNPLTPVDELPQKLRQLRQAQQQLTQLLTDAEGQVLHFLRKGPLAGRQAVVKKLIERFYPLGHLAANHSATLDLNVVNENIALAASGTPLTHWAKFEFDWDYASEYIFLPPTYLNKFANKLDWSALATNSLVDWNEALVRQHKHRTTDFFAQLSTNSGIAWSSLLLTAFTFEWNYSTDGLLGNSGLPWEDDDLPENLRELHAAKHKHDNDEEIDDDDDEEFLTEATTAAAAMRANYWQRHSADRFRDWTADYLRQHADQLDWRELSANPALPFSFALLTEFAEQWNWDMLVANHGLYQKALQPLLSDIIVDEFLTLYKS